MAFAYPISPGGQLVRQFCVGRIGDRFWKKQSPEKERRRDYRIFEQESDGDCHNAPGSSARRRFGQPNRELTPDFFVGFARAKSR